MSEGLCNIQLYRISLSDYSITLLRRILISYSCYFNITSSKSLIDKLQYEKHISGVGLRELISKLNYIHDMLEDIEFHPDSDDIQSISFILSEIQVNPDYDRYVSYEYLFGNLM